MARLYTNENIALQVVVALRRLGHDVLTSMDAGNANAGIPDPDVLALAAREDRVLVTHNRRHFLALHREGNIQHAGLVLCTFDPDFAGQANRIDAELVGADQVRGRVFRVNRVQSSAG